MLVFVLYFNILYYPPKGLPVSLTLVPSPISAIKHMMVLIKNAPRIDYQVKAHAMPGGIIEGQNNHRIYKVYKNMQHIYSIKICVTVYTFTMVTHHLVPSYTSYAPV